MSRRATKWIVGGIAVLAVAIGFWIWSDRERAAPPASDPALARVEPGSRDERIEAPAADGSGERTSAGFAAAQATAVTSAPYALVRVLVVDKVSRRPIGGMRVLARDAVSGPPSRGAAPVIHGKPGEALTTGADGRVEVEASPGTALRLLVYGDGEHGQASSRLESLEAGHTYEVELALPSGLDLPFWLKVVDIDTGSAIAGATIWDPDERGVPIADRTMLTTDAAGLVHLQSRSWIYRTLTVTARGYGRSFLFAEIGHETSERAYVLELRRGAELTVRVLDAARAPIAGAHIILGCAPYELGRRDEATSSLHITTGEDTVYSWSGITDAAGVYTFQDAPSRAALAGRVFHAGREWPAPAPVLLGPGETREITWVVGLEHVVRGRVVDRDGTPLGRCPIWMLKPDARGARYFDGGDQRPLEATTDDAGEFVFEGVASGSWLIGPAWTDNRGGVASTTPAAHAQSLEITDDDSEVVVDLRVDRGLTIRGVVLDAHERPAQRAIAHARSLIDRALCSAPVADDGTFVLGPVLAGSYEVTASSQRGLASVETLDARSGASGLVLHVPADGMIAGQVVGATGVGVSAHVGCVGWSARPLFAASTTTDVDGSFTLQQTGLEAVSIVATTVDGRVGVLGAFSFEEGAKPYDLVVRVDRGGRIRFRHEGAEDYPQVSVHQGDVVVGFRSVQRSIAEEFVVPPGRATVRVKYRRSGYEVVREVLVAADRTTDLVVEADAR